MPDTDALVRALLAAQFPQWAELPLEPVRPGGSDHLIRRLGTELSVRLPRPHAAAREDRDHRLLPGLAPHLPLAVPEPVALGEPGEGFPHRWSVTRWLPGRPPAPGGLADPDDTARRLARFLRALHAAPMHPGEKDAPARTLAERDEPVRRALAAVDGAFDSAALARIWQDALDAPAWDGPPVWFHGDFHTGNLLAEDGRITAVIDFGDLGAGDPSVDLMVAHTLLDAGPRAVFRAELGLDGAAWARGRGWSLAGGLLAHAAYAATRPDIAAATRRQILAVAADAAADR